MKSDGWEPGGEDDDGDLTCVCVFEEIDGCDAKMKMMMPIHNVNDVRQISTGGHARHRQHFLNTVNESSSRNYFKYVDLRVYMYTHVGSAPRSTRLVHTMHMYVYILILILILASPYFDGVHRGLNQPCPCTCGLDLDLHVHV